MLCLWSLYFHKESSPEAQEEAVQKEGKDVLCLDYFCDCHKAAPGAAVRGLGGGLVVGGVLGGGLEGDRGLHLSLVAVGV